MSMMYTPEMGRVAGVGSGDSDPSIATPTPPRPAPPLPRTSYLDAFTSDEQELAGRVLKARRDNMQDQIPEPEWKAALGVIARMKAAKRAAQPPSMVNKPMGSAPATAGWNPSLQGLAPPEENPSNAQLMPPPGYTPPPTPPRSMLGEANSALGTGAAMMDQGIGKLGAAVGDVIGSTGLPGSDWIRNQLGYGAQGGMVGKVEAPSEVPEEWSTAHKLAYKGVRTVAGAIPAVGAGVVTGGLSGLAGPAAMAAGALPIAAQAAGDTAAAAKETGSTPVQALTAGLASGVVAEVAGMAQLSAITNRMPGLKPMVDKAIKNAVARYAAAKGAEATVMGAVGVAQQAAEDAVHVYGGIDPAAFKDFWTKQAPEAFASNALITGVLGVAHDAPRLPGVIGQAVHEGSVRRGRLKDAQDLRQAQEYARTELPGVTDPTADRPGVERVATSSTTPPPPSPPTATRPAPQPGKPVMAADPIGDGFKVISPEGKVYVAGVDVAGGKRMYTPEAGGRLRPMSAGELQARGWRHAVELPDAKDAARAKGEGSEGELSRPIEPARTGESDPADVIPPAEVVKEGRGTNAPEADLQQAGQTPPPRAERKPKAPPGAWTTADMAARIAKLHAGGPAEHANNAIADGVEANGIEQGGGGIRTFAGKVPNDLTERLQGRPELRRLVRAETVKGKTKAYGHYYLSEVGVDKYVEMLEAIHANKPRPDVLVRGLRKDKGNAQAQLVADLWDNMPVGRRVPKETLKAETLRPGDTFTVDGRNAEVDPDRQLYISRHGKYDLEGLDEIPADKGSLKRAEKPPEENQDSEPAKGRELFRGSGRDSKESAYSEYASGGILGDDATYYAHTREDAQHYGPNIETRSDIVPKKPLVIRTDAEWKKATGQSQVNVISLATEQAGHREGLRGKDFDARVKELVAQHVAEARKKIQDAGHDAVVIELDHTDAARRLAEMFGHDQTIVFPKAEPARARPSQGSLLGERYEGGITGKQRGMFDNGEPEVKPADRYPGIRKGETPSEYEKRMGTTDTGGIDWENSTVDGLPFSPKRAEGWDSDLVGPDAGLAEAPRPQPVMPPRRAGLTPQPEKAGAKDSRITQTHENTPPAVARENKQMQRRGARDGKRIKTLREIMDQLTSALNERSVIAKVKRAVKRRASGHYKIWQGGVNIDGADNIDTFAHEIGHVLHEQIFPDMRPYFRSKRQTVDAVFPVAWRPELEKLGMALYGPTPPKAAVKYVGEGWAEFTRLLLTNTKLAKKLAPTTYKEAVGYLLEKYPETYDDLTRFRRDLAYALNAEDPLAKYIKRDVPTNVPKSWREIRTFARDVKSGIMTQFFDRHDPVRVMKRDLGIEGTLPANQDPEIAARLATPRANGHFDLIINYGQWAVGDYSVAKTGPGLAEILEPMRQPKDMERFESYMVAKRILEKRGQGFGGIFKHATDADLQRAIAETEAFYPEYKKAAEEFQKLNEWLVRDYAVYYNLLSPESAEQIIAKNLHYITFSHVMAKMLEGVQGGDGTGASGMADQSSGFNRFTGNSETLLSPVEAFIAHMRGVTKRAQLNDAGLKFVNLLKTDQGFGIPEMSRWIEKEDVPLFLRHTPDDAYQRKILSDLKTSGTLATLNPQQVATLVQQIAALEGPTFFEPQGPSGGTKNKGLVSLLRKGKREWYRVNNPALFEVLEGIGNPMQVGPVIEFFSHVANVQRHGATVLNPDFIFKNPLRDYLGSLFTAQNDASFARQFAEYQRTARQEGARLVRDTLNKGRREMSQTEAMYKHAGSDQAGFWNEINLGNGRVDLPAVLGRKTLLGKATDRAMTPVRRGLAGAAHVAKLQPLRRFNEVTESIQRIANAELLRRGRTDADSVTAAVMEYRDSTLDFNRGGKFVRMVNRVSPFFNPPWIAAHKIVRTVVGENARKTWAPNGRRAAWRFATRYLLPSMVLTVLNRDDPGHADLPSRVRDTNFLFAIRHDDPNDPKRGTTFIRIPKPQEVGAVIALTERAMSRWLGTDPITGERGDRQSFHGSAATIGDVLLPNLSINLFKPFMENAANYDFYWAKPIVPRRDLGLPPEFQGADRASDTARMLGSLTSSSPAKIDHLIYGYTAGLGRTTTRWVADPIFNAFGWPEKVAGPRLATSAPGLTVDQWPIARAFLYNSSRAQTESMLRFDDAYRRFSQSTNLYKRLASQASPAAQATAEKYFKENEREIVIGEILGEYNAAIQKLWKARFALDTSVDPDGAAKEAWAIEGQVRALIREATTEMRKIQSQPVLKP